LLLQQSTSDVTLPDAINVATASFRNLLAHSLSSGLVGRALGGSQTVRISPVSSGHAKSCCCWYLVLNANLLQCYSSIPLWRCNGKWTARKFSSSSTSQLVGFLLPIWSVSCVVQQHHGFSPDKVNRLGGFTVCLHPDFAAAPCYRPLVKSPP
jgi:hypothetical protein